MKLVLKNLKLLGELVSRYSEENSINTAILLAGVVSLNHNIHAFIFKQKSLHLIQLEPDFFPSTRYVRATVHFSMKSKLTGPFMRGLQHSWHARLQAKYRIKKIQNSYLFDVLLQNPGSKVVSE